MRGEQVLPLAPLAVPDALAPAQTLARNAAVTLFVERARAVLPSFTLTEANGQAIAELCVRLDGLPLVIELVAARINLLPPTALLSALDRRLALLSNGPRDLPARHQTLRTALAESYALLNEDARVLFRLLGVFVGGATVEAVNAVFVARSGQVDESDTLPPALSHYLFIALAALVDHSLVVQRLPNEREPRFTILETIREYALELLVEGGEAEAARRAHDAYFLALAERAERELHGPNQAAWLDMLEAEHANVRAAFEWLFAVGDIDGVLRLSGALGWLWFVRGYSGEGRQWLGRALVLALPTDGRTIEQSGIRQQHLARALYAAGHLALFQGDFAEARSRLEASVERWRSLAAQTSETAFKQEMLIALVFLFLTAQFQGDGAIRASLMRVPYPARIAG